MYPTIASIMTPKYRKAAEPSEPSEPTYEQETIDFMTAIAVPDNETTYFGWTAQEAEFVPPQELII